VTPLRARYTPEAATLIRTLHPEVKRHIRQAIRHLLDHPLAGHELQFELAGFRTFRMRTYRIIYRYDERTRSIDVVFVGHRRDVYESFRSLLMGRELSG
jgi:addiction module RelE/StbE family toxin